MSNSNEKQKGTEGFKYSFASLNESKRVKSYKRAFEYSTPVGVVNLALAILDIKKGESVVDYCSGEGAFLEAACKSVPNAKYTGIEIDPEICKRANSSAKEQGLNIEYVNKNALNCVDGTNPIIKADKAFSNFPLGVRVQRVQSKENAYLDALEQQHIIKRETTSLDWVFASLLANSLNEGGKAVAVVTSGCTFTESDSKPREHMVKSGKVHSVISLPSGVFMPYTSMKTYMVVLGEKPKEAIRFVDASDLGLRKRRTIEFDSACIEEILKRLQTNSKNSKLVPLKEVAAANFELVVGGFLKEPLEIPYPYAFEHVVKHVTRGCILSAAKHDEMVSGAKDTKLKLVTAANIIDGSIDDEGLPNINAIEPKQRKSIIENGNILLAQSGASFKVAVAEVPNNFTYLAAGNVYVIEVDENKVNPYYLAAFFTSEVGTQALKQAAVGTTVLALPIKRMLQMKVPIEDKARQSEVAQEYKQGIKNLKQARNRLKNARLKCENAFNVKVYECLEVMKEVRCIEVAPAPKKRTSSKVALSASSKECSEADELKLLASPRQKAEKEKVEVKE